MTEYTRGNVTDACATIMRAAGSDNFAIEMMTAEISLPVLCDYAAQAAFIADLGHDGGGPVLSACVVLRKALTKLKNEGMFGFPEEG